MQALIQRVKMAKVTVNEKVTGNIDNGYCVFLGIKNGDDHSDIDYIIKKLLSLKLFEGESKKFSKNINDINGEILVVSQFTLYSSLRKGTHPSFTDTMKPSEAKKIYNHFCDMLSEEGINVQKGVFGAYMNVELLNDGPATFNLSSDHLLKK